MYGKQLFIIISITLLIAIGCDGENKTRSINGTAVPTKKATPDKKSTKNKVIDSKESKGATPEQLAKAKELIAAISKDEISSINALMLFRSNCGICHGFKGNMKLNGAKDLTISKITLEESVAQVYFGKGLMTPFKGVLKDAEIVALGHYVETLRK